MDGLPVCGAQATTFGTRCRLGGAVHTIIARSEATSKSCKGRYVPLDVFATARSEGRVSFNALWLAMTIAVRPNAFCSKISVGEKGDRNAPSSGISPAAQIVAPIQIKSAGLSQTIRPALKSDPV